MVENRMGETKAKSRGGQGPCTFSNRFDAFVNKHDPPSLLEYVAEFPMLKKGNYVR